MGQNLKAWHIVLFVAAVSALGVSAFFTFRGSGVEFSNRVMLVDVKTGQIYAVDSSNKTITVPARHPETGERTLFPVEREEKGEWRIDPRALRDLDESGLAVPEVVETGSGRVIGATRTIRNLTPKDLMSSRRQG